MNNMVEILPDSSNQERITPVPPTEKVGDRQPNKDKKKIKIKPKKLDDEKKLPPDPFNVLGKKLDEKI
jgi:hypothetical protein